MLVERGISRDEIILIVSEYIYMRCFYFSSNIYIILREIELDRIISEMKISRSGIILSNVILSRKLHNEMLVIYYITCTFLKVSLTVRLFTLQNEIIIFW